MKVNICIFIAVLGLFSCSHKTPESVKAECLADKTTQQIYGSNTKAYCDCVEQKLKAIADSSKLDDKSIEATKQSCANEYTNLDTNF